MIYAQVVGTIWATRKDPMIEGLPLMLVERIDLDGKPLGTSLIAVDTVSAGVGERVLVAQGSSARQTEKTRDRPVDAVIMAIVDNLELRERVR
ncbi:MAG: EutN/CcmL family microcompartment protein [Planctomycetota bacterium]